ncbi:DUF4429 domain-containing protein [Nocardiopsis terrae]
MDELRGDQASWVFDSQAIAIRYETKGWFRSPLLKLLERVDVPVSAIQDVDFRPGAGRRNGWVMNLRLHDRMDPYAAVGAALDDKAQPFRLTGPARTELVAEYLADQIRFAAGRAAEPDPATPTRLVPALPLYIRTCEGTARLEPDRLTLVWAGAHASGYKKKKQRREYDLADITGVEWAPLDDWGWGFVRIIAGGTADAAKPKNDLNVLRAGDGGNESHQAFLLAATVTAHRWALGAATRAALGSGEAVQDGAGPGLDDPEWWKNTARTALEAVRGPRPTTDLPGDTGADAADGGPGDGGAPPQPADTTWIFEQIERLGDLHAKGLLTDEEFSTKKAELLDRI